MATPDTIDARKYGRLLARVLPSVIESEAEYARLANELERLATRGEGDLSPEQLRLLTSARATHRRLRVARVANRRLLIRATPLRRDTASFVPTLY